VPLPSPSSREEWVQLAQIRITSILKVRIAANIHQLESKIAESGPHDKLPQPHIIQEALTRLIEAGVIRRIQPKRMAKTPESGFYTLAEFYPDPANHRIQQLRVPYRVYRLLTGTDDYCSRPLEDIVRASFNAATAYEFLGKLPKEAPLDGVYRRTKRLLGVEVKNHREWIYPMSAAAWVMIRKCLALDAVPFLVSRKIAYITRAVFARLGILGFEFHRQVFSPAVAPYLTDIQHTDRLGYKDVIALPPEPYPPLVGFLQRTIPEQIEASYERWTTSKDLLTEFAVERGLGNPKMSDPDRHEHYDDFARRVFYGEHEVENWD
jgi:hypothetical protein